MTEIIFPFCHNDSVFDLRSGGSFKIFAILLFVLEITCAEGNLQVFPGPETWTVSDTVTPVCGEKYVLLCGSMHVAISLKRTGRPR